MYMYQFPITLISEFSTKLPAPEFNYENLSIYGNFVPCMFSAFIKIILKMFAELKKGRPAYIDHVL
jgi:hypothetical protein